MTVVMRKPVWMQRIRSSACDVTDATNDKKPAAPMAQATLETLEQAGMKRPTDDRGEPQAIVATLDKGYYSEAAAQALEEMGFDPSRAAGRVPHHGAPPETREAPKIAQERMAAVCAASQGALYARRKVIAEPVFGQIKEGGVSVAFRFEASEDARRMVFGVLDA